MTGMFCWSLKWVNGASVKAEDLKHARIQVKCGWMRQNLDGTKPTGWSLSMWWTRGCERTCSGPSFFASLSCIKLKTSASPGQASQRVRPLIFPQDGSTSNRHAAVSEWFKKDYYTFPAGLYVQVKLPAYKSRKPAWTPTCHLQWTARVCFVLRTATIAKWCGCGSCAYTELDPSSGSSRTRSGVSRVKTCKEAHASERHWKTAQAKRTFSLAMDEMLQHFTALQRHFVSIFACALPRLTFSRIPGTAHWATQPLPLWGQSCSATGRNEWPKYSAQVSSSLQAVSLAPWQPKAAAGTGTMLYLAYGD